MFGKQKINKMKTAFHPVSPYGVSKCFAHWIQKIIEMRTKCLLVTEFYLIMKVLLEETLLQKIVQALVRIKKGSQKKLFLGNLYSKRDWGHAKDYVMAMWKMLQQNKPDDYVISTGETFTIKDFVNIAAKKIGLKIKWFGKGVKEKAINLENKKIIVECRKRYFRPLEVDYLKGNASKAKKILKWSSTMSINDLIEEMLQYELENYYD